MHDYEYRSVIDACELLDPQEFMRRRAAQLVAEKRSEIVNGGEAEDDPLSDLLGGARMAVAFEEMERSEAAMAYENHENDIRTAYTEALLKSGHISETTAELNAPGEATIGDVAHWEIFLRAAPKSNPDVCTAEVAEEFLSAALYKSPALRDKYYLAVISPSRPDTKGSTMMVRFIGFEQATTGKWTRVTHQLYVDNSSTKDANRLLCEWGVRGEADDDLTEIEMLSRPTLLRRSQFPEGVASAAQMLDMFASERLGQPVFCGVPMKDKVELARYEELALISKKRETQMLPEIKRLARDVYDIVAKKHLSFAEENQAYTQLLLASLRRICSDHPEYAEAAFGQEAARYYQQAYERMAAGDSDGAASALGGAYDRSTSVTICDTTVGEQESQDTSQTEAERQEALHCLELKVKGYTIRRNVKCPACYDVTGRKVDAYETVDSIRCMCEECGYHINKETGAVIAESRITKRADEKTKDDNEAAKATLTPGRSYRLGATYYLYSHDYTREGPKPRFTTDDGETITGQAARNLENAIVYMQEVPLLWMLWLYKE